MQDVIQAQTYLIGLIGLLAIIAILVGRQLLKVRNDEIKLVKLEKNETSASKEASQLYELASVQLRKRLYPQATTTLKKALKRLNSEPDEAKAIIENALGFALAAQDDFEAAVIHYKSALKARPDYPVALNNLAFAKQKLNEPKEAESLYRQVLTLEPSNKTALRQIKKFKDKKNSEPSNNTNSKGF